ncbi:hypothetical protein Srot_2228 [Segniliparus rotundus DSM 44985]|uniref:Uncharacterized protein n=1 Tax=Segniliparus rotundus (strain ATCC BAA-972 / CDC 1076 / CIP 108378 / DSM 44985 / JCM 13578) TaxID=640132 RepID=D6ZA09_SEGRD|nr:hypothetical protein [Segniliparus rotundus]ADG98679.1 hypothetical protein Srot_2228 [Segniliparus rotundus DSM 44985]
MAGADYLAMVSDPEALLRVAKSIDGPAIERLLGDYQHMARAMAEVGQFGHDADGAAAAQLFGKFVDEAHHESAVLSYAALNIADTCNRMKAKLANFSEQYVEKVQPAAHNLQEAYDAQLGLGSAGSLAELRVASTALATALGHLYTDLAGNPTIDIAPTFPAAAIPDIGADGRRDAAAGGSRRPRDDQSSSAALGGEHGVAGAAGHVPVGPGKNSAGQDGPEQASPEGSAGSAVGALGSTGPGLAGAARAGAGFAADAAGLAASLAALATPASAAVPFGDANADEAEGGGKIGGSAAAAATQPAADHTSVGAAGAGASTLADSASSRLAPPPELRQAAPTASPVGQPVSGGAGAGPAGGTMGMPMMGAAGMAGANAEHRVASYLITKEHGERQFTNGLPLASEEILGVLDERERLAMQIASIDDDAAQAR